MPVRGTSVRRRCLVLPALSILVTAWLLDLPSHAATAPPKVYRDRIEPHWFADNTRFWYRLDLPAEAREFLVVDVARAVREPAFDHRKVAEALTRITGQPVAAARLPIESLEYRTNTTTVELRGETASWRLDLESYEVTAIEGADAGDGGLPVLAEAQASRRTGPETAIVFENRLAEEVAVFWMDETGERRAYGVLKPREVRRQHTFAGHVWAVFRSGTYLAAFEAGRSPRRAVIDGRPPSTRPTTAPERNRRTLPSAVRSPDGTHEAYVRDHNLWLRHLASGRERPLSFDGSPGDSFRKDVQRDRLVGMTYDAPEPPATLPEVFWSPDSTKLVALQTRSVPERQVQIVESSPRDQLQPRLVSYPYLKAGDEIPIQTPRLFDVVNGREIPFARDLFQRAWQIDEFRWAPDNSRFTFLYNQRGHQVLRVLAVTPVSDGGRLATNAVVTALVDEVCPTFFDYSNKTYLEFLDATHELIWMSERSGWNHLYLVDARTGAVKNPITRGDWVVRGVERLDAEARQIWFRASGIRPGQDPYHVHLARINLDGTGLTVVTEGDGTHETQWSPDRRYLIDSWSRVDQPPVTELRRASDGALVCVLEQADAIEVLRARGRFPERFVAKARDGVTDIFGIIHRPAGFDPARQYPVIENIYAGPHGQHVPKAFRPSYRHQEEIADRGFVVVQVDGMGTNWRSKRFHDMAWRNIGDAGFPDRIAWIKAAAARHPEFDLRKVGIYGGSAGGQNALRALLAHGDFYRAAVADCGCHDNRMDKIWWNEAWMGWPVGPHYAEQSNVTQATNLVGKLLLVVGELDRNVDPSTTLQVVNALVKADKDFDFLMIPGTGHGAAETDYGRRRRADFFVRHLH